MHLSLLSFQIQLQMKCFLSVGIIHVPLSSTECAEEANLLKADDQWLSLEAASRYHMDSLALIVTASKAKDLITLEGTLFFSMK